MTIEEDTTSQRILDRGSLARDVRALSVVRATPAILSIGVQWLVIACAVTACVLWRHWPVYIAAMLVVSTRQHALGVLTHEAAHYRLFRNRTVNDVIADLFISFPSGISTSVYRKLHFEHHRFVNTEKDPNIQLVANDEDWLWPKLPWECAKLFIGDLVGVNCRFMAAMLWSWSPWPRVLPREGIRWNLPAGERWRLMIFVLALGSALIFIPGAWKLFLLLWIIPGATFLNLIVRVRNLAEHYGVENQHELNASRHVSPLWWERFLFAPCNINYHLEHHLFPSVPFYNLPKLHARLIRDETFKAHAHLTESYTGVVKGVLGELLAPAQQVT